MPFYNIAGLRVKMKHRSGRTEKQAKLYLSEIQDESVKADIELDVTEDRIVKAVEEHPELTEGDWEYMLSGSDFYSKLIDFNGILLHSSCVVVDGVAYAFSADSGTGKSTHTQLWLKKFGDRAYILNDDKPALRIIDGKVYACGTPWSGKYDCSAPVVVPLGAICFLERSEENYIKPEETSRAIYSVFSQTIRKFNTDKMNLLLDNIDIIFKQVPIFRLGCNISEDAVNCSYNAMKRDKNDL